MMGIINNASMPPGAEAHDMAYLQARFDAIKCGEIPYALVHVNIKNFRYFNTKYSSVGGDEILQLVLQRIFEFLDGEEYAAWLYADNFGMLLQYESANQLIYERMMQFIDRIYRIEDERIYRNISISMGLYQITDREITFPDALNYANLCRKECDTLLGRSCCMELYAQNFYDAYMNRMDLEAATADAYKNYEFVTYLQPVVALDTGRIVGAEALLRWFDQKGQEIPLSRFLPILNQNRYIEIIDLDTFDQMCTYLDRRIKANEPVVPISFNLSKATFYDPNVMSDYSKNFEKYNIPKDLIEIELTESISMDDSQRLKQVVAEFKSAGFRCALDDFGNGYSSLHVLLNVPIDTVKMDHQFFIDSLNDDNKRMIETVIRLLHSLNMKVVAEGVEREEHIAHLKACGCDYVQGYYYYQPMPIDQFDALLDAQKDDCIQPFAQEHMALPRE